VADDFLAKQLPHNVTWGLTMLYSLEHPGNFDDNKSQDCPLPLTPNPHPAAPSLSKLTLLLVATSKNARAGVSPRRSATPIPTKRMQLGYLPKTPACWWTTVFCPKMFGKLESRSRDSKP